MPTGARAAEPPVIEPPRLVAMTEPTYPDEARARGVEGVVSLRLLVDKAGAVLQAEVLASSDAAFEEPARVAALGLRFAPATRDGVPVAARIVHVFRFRPPADERNPPTPEPETPEPETPEPETREPSAPESKPTDRAEPPPAQEVTVRGSSSADRLRRSAEAVHVVDTTVARREAADLGEVLARTQGIGILRAGGLGSRTRLALNGLTDDQVRVFFDGVPLELAGFGTGLANVPVNFVERVEVYRGVVPIRFGVDALGGAVNLVSPEPVGRTRAGASYQVGSFGTYRVNASASHTDTKTGVFVAANSFYDGARNDFPVDVLVGDRRGQESSLRVRRTHDAYHAMGAGVELGIAHRPWARRLSVRLFGTGFDKEIPHNAIMSVPYGAARYGETAYGAVARYEHPTAARLAGGTLGVRLLAGYVRRAIDFVDRAEVVYDWYGRPTRPRPEPGEIGKATDQTVWEDTAMGRAELQWAASSEHAIRLVVSPTSTSRWGENRLSVGRDPLAAQRGLLRVVTGLEHQLDVLEGRLQNVAFLKSYVMQRATDEVLPGGAVRALDTTEHRMGGGDALRYRVSDALWIKASYELATRLPRPDEIFGDGVLVTPNLRLTPETSHNGNVGATLDARGTNFGNVRADVNLFVRSADRLIVRLGDDRYANYQNVFSARSVGVEASGGWTSPHELLSLDGNVTFQDFRNTSSEGTFANVEGDRIPNRPWLMANASARLNVPGLGAAGDQLSLGYYLRYVQAFYRGWESVGLLGAHFGLKDAVPSQLVHTVALTYLVRAAGHLVSSTLEVDNLTDEPTFDLFGMRRPGRAIFFKGAVEL